MVDKGYSQGYSHSVGHFSLFLVFLLLCVVSSASLFWMTVSLCARSAHAFILATQLLIQSDAAEVRIWNLLRKKHR